MAGIMSLAKQGQIGKPCAMLLSANKSLTWQLRLDQWDKQPASHSKGTCLVCHFSNSVPNGFLWRSNGQEIQHQPALYCGCSKKNTVRKRRHLLAGRKSILLLCMASTCLPFRFPTCHCPRFEDQGTDWDRWYLPFHWGKAASWGGADGHRRCGFRLWMSVLCG